MKSPTYVRSSDRRVWSQKAACIGANTENYFLHGNRKPGIFNCSECPVVRQCQEYALVHEEYGVWGGLSEKERRRYRETSDFDILALQAQREGWLEPHHLIPYDLLQEIQMIGAAQASPRETNSETRTVFELDFSLPALPSF